MLRVVNCLRERGRGAAAVKREREGRRSRKALCWA